MSACRGVEPDVDVTGESHRLSALVLHLNGMFSDMRETGDPRTGLQRAIGAEQRIENQMAAVTRDIRPEVMSDHV